MTDKIVLDASAILALLKMEQGHEMVAEHLENAIVSSINFCEVITVVSRKGFGQENRKNGKRTRNPKN